MYVERAYCARRDNALQESCTCPGIGRGITVTDPADRAVSARLLAGKYPVTDLWAEPMAETRFPWKKPGFYFAVKLMHRCLLESAGTLSMPRGVFLADRSVHGLGVGNIFNGLTSMQ